MELATAASCKSERSRPQHTGEAVQSNSKARKGKSATQLRERSADGALLYTAIPEPTREQNTMGKRGFSLLKVMQENKSGYEFGESASFVRGRPQEGGT